MLLDFFILSLTLIGAVQPEARSRAAHVAHAGARLALHEYNVAAPPVGVGRGDRWVWLEARHAGERWVIARI